MLLERFLKRNILRMGLHGLKSHGDWIWQCAPPREDGAPVLVSEVLAIYNAAENRNRNKQRMLPQQQGGFNSAVVAVWGCGSHIPVPWRSGCSQVTGKAKGKFQSLCSPHPISCMLPPMELQRFLVHA